MGSTFELKVFGFKYSGWKSIRLTRSIEQLAPSMAVKLTDRWTPEMQPTPIEGGDPFVLEVDGERIITGFVDIDSHDYGLEDRVLGFTGRARTGDLVDCAAIYKTGRWRQRPLLQIAKDLCEPFGVEASTRVELGAALGSFGIEEGETAFEALSRACRMRAVLMLTDSYGDLYFDRVGTKRVATVLEFGKNIKRGRHTNDWSERFSTYSIKAQAAGNDNLFGAEAAEISRTATDEGVNRYRPTSIISESEANAAELQKRVNWERNVRAGRSKRSVYTVPGWRHADGLWEPNTVVRVKDPYIGCDDDLLISSVTQTRDETQGEITELTLGIPQAFSIEPLPKPQRRKKASAFWSFLHGLHDKATGQ